MIHKTTRSILSVLLAALLLVTSVPLTPAFADGGGVSLQSANNESRELAGAGTESDPYRIATANDLREFAQRVNNGQIRADANAILTADIVLNEKIEVDENGTVTNKEDLSEWTPIGSDSQKYSGTFDGNGKTISGLYIDSDADYQGLFGYLSTEGDNTVTVQNLSVSGTVSGKMYVGGIVGYNFSGTVTNCAFSGSVSGTYTYVGGVVGYNSNGIVINSYNTGEVSGSNTVGGVVGSNSSSASVTNSYNTGKVSGSKTVGGVVGNNSFRATVTNCYNTGNVSGPYSGSDSNVGGVVGRNGGTVTGCYFLKDTAGSGIGNEGSAAGAAVVEDLDALCGKFKDTTTWSINPVLGRPVLNKNWEGGDGSPDSPYEISTADQLENFRDIVNGASGNPAAWAVLMNDIDLSSVCGAELSNGTSWEPIGNSIRNSYEGTFDGDGHTISGLYINNTSDNYQGLFGRVNGGTVQDLSVSGSVKGDDYVGGVVGYNYSGIVTGCIFSGSGSVSGVTGSDYVGGVVGDNGSSASVENCYNTGSVNGSADSSSVGGVVGDNSGTVKNCYNTDAVSGSGWYVGGVVGSNSGTVENCYNTDKVSGNRSVGGVVGQNFGSGSVTNCYFLQTTEVNDKLQGIGGGSGTSSNVEPRTADAFHSGEVAWRLQDGQADGSSQVWGQNIKDGEKDNYPQLRAFDTDTPQVYKVAFMNDSEEHDAKYANNGMTVGSPTTNPTKEGHTFAGWFTESSGGSQWNFSTAVTENMTLYAQWTPHTYSITASPSALDFGSITEGEERPAAQNVTVKNTGNQAVTLEQPTAENFEIAKIDDLALDAGESVKLTIQPKDKLPRGSYSEQIVVSNTNGEKATITATFTVKEPPYTGKYSYEVSTSVGDHGSLTVDRYATEGDKVTIDVTPDQAYKLDELVVTANGKDVELTANSDGTYTFTMPSADVKISATFAEDPDWTEPEEPATDVSDLFIDIAPDAWYKDAIQYAYDNGLMTGVSATEFAPEATTTRAMIVSILARLEGVESAQAAGFADVTDEWYATAVNWAANVGVVNGYEDNTFKPNTAITREQLAAILMNYAAYKGYDVSARADLSHYSDADSISSWANDVLLWAVAEGLLTGVTDDTIAPQAHATRAQVAAILQRFLSE